MPQLIARYGAWGRALEAKGQSVGGHTLTDDGGTHVRRTGGALAAADHPLLDTPALDAAG